MPGVLHLDGDLAPVVEGRAVDLPDRRGGDRLLVERREDAVEALAVLALEHAPHVVERHARRGVAQLGERRLHLVAVGRRHGVEVDDRQHLAGLHRDALHRAEHAHDLPRRVDLAAAERIGRVVRRAARFAAEVAAYFAASVAASRPSAAVRRSRPPSTSPSPGSSPPGSSLLARG